MDCCVIGIGTFGYNVCTTLMHHGVKVLAIDRSLEVIESIQEKVTHAICLKVFDEESLRVADVQSVDAVVIAMGDNFQDSVMIAALLKRKFEIPMVVCRAANSQHQEILELIGVNYVVLPEQEAGIRLADKLSIRYRNFTRITQNYSITYVKPTKKWIGKKIEDIGDLQDESITILGKKSGETIKKISPDYIIKNDDIIALAGENSVLSEYIS
jgi:trk system potassium uptake protein TrkA